MNRISVKLRFSRKVGILLFSILLIIVLLILHKNFFLAHSKMIPANGGIYTESTIGQLKNLSPFSQDCSLLDKDIQNLIFEGLLKYNPVSGKIEDGLAQMYIKNTKTYTLTLRDSAKFQDGESITIDDIIFTFESIIQNPNFENKFLHEAFSDVELQVIDKKTIEFVLLEPNFFFPALLTIPILPQKYFEDAYIEEVTDPHYKFNKKPIGAGPYILKNIVPDYDGSFRVFLEKNKYYYADAPKVDQVVLYVHPSFENLNEFHSWTTAFSNIPAIWIKKFEEKLFKEYQLDAQYEKKEFTLSRFVGIFFNLDSEHLQYLSLRKALKSAINKEKLLENEKGWEPINSFFFSEGIENSPHIADYTEARKDLRDGGFPYNKSLEKRTAGKSGDPIKLIFITSTAPPVYSRFAQIITRKWEKELDIEIELKILPPEEFEIAIINRDYDILLFGQNFSQNFDSLSMWHSSESKKYNVSNLTNKNVDFFIDEILSTGSQTDLFSLNEKLDKLVPAVPLITPTYNLFYSNQLLGFRNNFGIRNRAHSDRFSNINNWYFLEKLDWDWPRNKSKFWGFFKWIFNNEDNTVVESKEAASEAIYPSLEQSDEEN